MLSVRRSEKRGHYNHGWLETYHSFSFADYYDPHHMGFRDLRVLNEDRVQPGQGFGSHSHRDMEILTYVLEGALQHKDSMGNASIIRPGELQRMSAGTGVTHSEFNASDSELVHFLQIWILPKESGLKPSYEQQSFAPEEFQGKWRLLASPDGAKDSVTLHQNVHLYAARLAVDQELFFQHTADRYLWLQVARGEVRIGDTVLRAGDGASQSQQAGLCVVGVQDAELLLFDLD